MIVCFAFYSGSKREIIVQWSKYKYNVKHIVRFKLVEHEKNQIYLLKLVSLLCQPLDMPCILTIYNLSKGQGKSSLLV